jgi:hypothetical protein
MRAAVIAAETRFDRRMSFPNRITHLKCRRQGQKESRRAARPANPVAGRRAARAAVCVADLYGAIAAPLWPRSGNAEALAGRHIPRLIRACVNNCRMPLALAILARGAIV